MANVDRSLSLAQRVDAACDSFERAWRAGHCPRVDDYVAAAPEPDRDPLRSALVAVEAELKAGRAVGDTSVGAESVRAGGQHDPTATVLRPPAQSVVPHRIGRFEVREVLGSGAFGRVYRAFDPTLDREVALKVPLAGALPADADRAPFLKEARAAATVSHPNICQIYEVGEHAGAPFIVMALVLGQSLAEVLRGRTEPLPERQAAVIVHKLALALDAAHKKGVIHRDLKPANVMFDKERNELVVMDFGLARRSVPGDARDTQNGIVMGTPAYMSPEQARGEAKDVGPATDIFSLGIIMYELLTGSRPFTGTVHEVIGRIMLMDPEPPSARRPGISPVLEAACLKALAKDPTARFASMQEFAEAVDGYLRPPVDQNAELAWAVETKPDGGAEAGLSTDTRKLAELFQMVSEQRKIEKAETAAAVEAAAARHRTPRWIFAALALLLVGGFAAVAAVVFFTRNDKVKVTIELKGIDLSDKAYSFTLDGQAIAAQELAEPIELKPGDHELVVSRNAAPVMRYVFVVIGGRNPRIEPREVEQLAPPPIAPTPIAPTVQPDPKSPGAEDGFVTIFSGKDLTGWESGTHPEAFHVDADGNITAKGDARLGEIFWLLTKKEYADYILRLEFQFAEPPPGDTHSGVAIRSGPNHIGARGMQLEVQLRDTAKGALSAGAVIFGEGNAKQPLVPIGQPAPGTWHALEIEFRGQRVKVTIDGKLVNDVDLTKFLVLRSWARAELDRKKGHIGLHSWRHPTQFRNIRVKELVGAPESEAGPGGAIVSTFDKDDEGWTVAGDARGGVKPTYHKNGGKPGGYLSAKDDRAGGVWYWVAPKKFLGDRSASYGKTLSFDLTQSITDSPFDDSDVILEGETMTLVFKLPKHPDTKWTSYKVPLTASKGWKANHTSKDATEDELKAVLKSLKRLWIRGEYASGYDIGQLDNVSLEK